MSDVTVLMPVYNAMPYLRQAVDSILDQTLRDFTCLIIDDGSTDGSRQYLDGLKDPRLQVVHRPHCGVGAALSAGLELCQTELLARMDADDLSLPTRLETQVNFLRAHPEVGMVSTQFAYFGLGGRRVLSPRMPCGHRAIYADLLHGRLSLVHGSMMCRTSVLKRAGGYRVEGAGEDWDMFLRMGEAARLANLNESLYLWRVHPGTLTWDHLAKTQLRIQHACQCARRRAQHRAEITFDEFVHRQRARAFWQRAATAMDFYALAQYRRGLIGISNAQPVRGYARLAWAAFCSPGRTSKRMWRAIRALRKLSILLHT